MSGSIFGTIFQISTWGESHGKAVGVTIDGCPAGIPLTEEDVQIYLDRRKPGQSQFTTARKEADTCHILSGIFEGKTTGTPISIIVNNEDQHSRDYSNIADCYRPGHADYTFDMKYGFRDYRGGGRSSARETIARVAAGAVAAKLLAQLGIEVHAYTKSIGPVSISKDHFDLNECSDNPLNMPDAEAAVQAMEYASAIRSQCNSCGGVVECYADGVPAGLGQTVFDKMDALLAHAIMSIGAVKGVEIGDGFDVTQSTGLVNNDSFIPDQHGGITKATNHAGGILGGMTDGSRIILRAAFKPTPSIASPQKTVNTNGEPIELVIKGRHDPLVVPRAVVVVEAMTALTIADLLLINMTSRMDKIREFYQK